MIVAGLEPITFTAFGEAIPQTLAKVSGDEQQGAVGTELAAPLVVSILDQSGVAYAGATVTFAITAGGWDAVRRNRHYRFQRPNRQHFDAGQPAWTEHRRGDGRWIGAGDLYGS